MLSTVYDDFVRRFVWTKQGPLQGLRILKEDGPVQGDCRNFALTIAWLASGRSMIVMILNLIIGNTVLWFCWNKGPHMSVWENGNGWICSSFRTWHQKSPNIRLLPLQPVLFGAILALYLI